MKFNKTVKAKTKTVNYAGGEAYQESPKLEFVSILLTSMLKGGAYRSEAATVSRIQELIKAIPDKKFIAQAAIYARTQHGLRSVSHLVAGELPQYVSGQSWLRKFFNKVVYRPDDMLEIMAYYLERNGGFPYPRAMKYGFQDAFARFDSYQLAKYRGENSAVKMVDLVNLVHPKARQEVLKALMSGTLKSTETRESKLSAAGQISTEGKTEGEIVAEKLENKKEAWEDLIGNKKIGYFALLKNLRNIYEQAPHMVVAAAELLVDRIAIKRSLVLPFRFLDALEEIEKLGDGRIFIKALNEAIEISLDNVPKFEGSTLVVLDGSGSMTGQPLKIGSLFAAMLYKVNNADFMTFSNSARYVSFNPSDSLLTIAQGMARSAENEGTNFHAIFRTAHKGYTRIIILSDMQGWVGHTAPTESYAQYKKKYATQTQVYSFDLTGLGTLQFPEQHVFTLAGVSEKAFDVLTFLEQDKGALLKEIEKIEL
jgi:60 kDa SS-A/Ro ribonucleoprotein